MRIKYVFHIINTIFLSYKKDFFSSKTIPKIKILSITFTVQNGVHYKIYFHYPKWGLL